MTTKIYIYAPIYAHAVMAAGSVGRNMEDLGERVRTTCTVTGFVIDDHPDPTVDLIIITQQVADKMNMVLSDTPTVTVR